MKSVNFLRRSLAVVLVALAWTTCLEIRAQEGVFEKSKTLDLVQREKTTSARSLVEYSNDSPEGIVRLEVDRKDRRYQTGDQIVVTVTSSVDGYLYLFNVDSEGTPTLLIPNRSGKENRIRSGIPTVYPPKGADFKFAVTGATGGRETFKAFVTPTKLKLPEDATSKSFYQVPDSELKRMLEQMQNLDARAKVISSTRKVATSVVEYLTSPRKERRFFVGIAVSEFQDENIPDLKSCVEDVDAVASFWNTRGGVSPKRSFVLKNKQATKENIRDLFARLCDDVCSDDVVVIYVSTHGWRDSKDTYIIPYDGREPGKIDAVESFVSTRELERWLEALKICKILFFVDACYSGGLFDSSRGGLGNDKELEEEPFFFGPGSSVSKSISQDSVYGICSCAKDQESFAGKSSMSVFTEYLVEAFQSPEVRTHKDVKKYVRPKVNEYMKNNLYDEKRQTVVEQDRLNPGVLLNAPN